ncbi:MAG: DUF998 domain-containing protein [Pyrinomonadaceae bacterium]
MIAVDNSKDAQEQDAGGSSQLVLSYMGLRKVIGYIGVGLPFVLPIGWWLLPETHPSWPGSMSGYYWTSIGNVFVGTLCAIGVFLFSYCGYDRRDKIAGRLACVFAVGVAMFPVCPDANYTPVQKTVGWVHLTCASLLFATLAYFSLCLFTLSDPAKPMTIQKQRRNRVYRLCGWTIAASLVLVFICEVLVFRDNAPFSTSPLRSVFPVFILEGVMVLAFGISWLTKGEAILADGE